MSEETSPFVEVFCEISCKNYRFTTGTKVEFAVSVINRKLGSFKSRVIYIEATKKDEEPISSSLVKYGHGWKFKTVIDASDFLGTEKNDIFQRHLSRQFPSVLSMGSKYSNSTDQSLKYTGRIMFAFALMFILGGLFTIALENLPTLVLLFNNPSM